MTEALEQAQVQTEAQQNQSAIQEQAQAAAIARAKEEAELERTRLARVQEMQAKMQQDMSRQQAPNQEQMQTQTPAHAQPRAPVGHAVQLQTDASLHKQTAPQMTPQQSSEVVDPHAWMFQTMEQLHQVPTQEPHTIGAAAAQDHCGPCHCCCRAPASSCSSASARAHNSRQLPPTTLLRLM